MKITLFPKLQRVATVDDQLQLLLVGVFACFGVILLGVVVFVRLLRYLGVQ